MDHLYLIILFLSFSINSCASEAITNFALLQNLEERTSNFLLANAPARVQETVNAWQKN